MISRAIFSSENFKKNIIFRKDNKELDSLFKTFTYVPLNVVCALQIRAKIVIKL